MTMRSAWITLLAAAVAAAALSGCGSPATGSAAPSVAPAAPPLPADSPNGNDGRPPTATVPRAASTAPGSFPAGSTMAKIKKRGYLRVATNGDVLNWGATDTKTGDPEGYDVELAGKIAEALDLKT